MTTDLEVEAYACVATRCEEIKGWVQCLCEHGNYYWIPLRCRKCAGCLQAKSDYLLHRLAVDIPADQNFSFLTLTSLAGTEWEAITKGWNALITALRREYGGIEYAWIKEEGQRTGSKHLHILLFSSSRLRQSLVQTIWKRLIGAYIIKLTSVKNKQIAYYILKDMAKGKPFQRRMMSFSRGWPKSPKLPRPMVIERHLLPPVMTPGMKQLENGIIVYADYVPCDCFSCSRGYLNELKIIREPGFCDNLVKKRP